jgi:HAD superfamily hydrolase (TIGR01509 family)
MLRAIIFDCDGVIADTEPLHLATFQKVLEEEGIELTREEYYASYLAFDDRSCFTNVYRDRGVPLSRDRLTELVERKAAFLEPVMRESLHVFPGVVEFIREAWLRYPLAVASGALAHEVELVLQHAGVRTCFQVIVAAEEVVSGKPDPEPFLTACTRLSASQVEVFGPHECLAIEDSMPGVRAAHLAGMRCLAVTNTYPKERLVEADLIVGSLDGLSLTELEDLFSN